MNSDSPDTLTFEAIEQARERIGSAVAESPCPKSEHLSNRLGCKVFLKLENLQRTGSFKERGARNRLAMLSEQQKQRGVIAASAGNHAQAVAYHGRQMGISTKIVMPENTPLIKVTRTEQFGADVELHGSTYDDAYQRALELTRAENRTLIHPFDDIAVMAGQGTIGLELLEQNPYINTVVVPIGGGGLASGVATALREINPNIHLIGVEAESVPSMKRSFEAGRVIKTPSAHTLADGIAVQQVSERTFAACKKHLDEVVTVTEQQIANAVLVMLENDKTVAEGAGAAPIAALLAGKIEKLENRQVCTIVSGGNIDVNVINRIIESGLVAAGRLSRIRLQLRDVPGKLADVLEIIGNHNINVLEIYHNRTFMEEAPVGMTNVEVKLETRGAEQIDALRETLEQRGYQILEHI